jgi:hypothetical protein
MKTLFVFGCSYTEGNGCYPHEEYCKKYKKHETDLMWPIIVANKLNCKLVNLGLGGASNDKILDRIMINFDNINEGDIVIIEKTFTHRFDFPLSNKLETITPFSQDTLKERHGYTPQEIEHLTFVGTQLDSTLISYRQNYRFDFLGSQLMKLKNIENYILWEVTDYHVNMERIFDETKGEINDMHWSFSGHKNFASIILEKLSNNKTLEK